MLVMFGWREMKRWSKKMIKRKKEKKNTRLRDWFGIWTLSDVTKG